MVTATSVQLVIFDCDGVLVDSEPIAASVFSKEIQELGLNLSMREVDARFRGHSLKDCQREVEVLLGRKLDDAFLHALNERTFEAFREGLSRVRGAAEAVLQLQRKGLKTCVASSGSHEKMQLTLSLTGLLPLLEGRLFSATQVERGKPAPDLVRFAARSMGCAPGHCLVVEDSIVGARGALAAKMQVLGLVDSESSHLDEESRQRTQHAFEALGVPTFERMLDLPGLVRA